MSPTGSLVLLYILDVCHLPVLSLWLLHSTWYSRVLQQARSTSLLTAAGVGPVTFHSRDILLTPLHNKKIFVGALLHSHFSLLRAELITFIQGFRALYQLHPALHSLHIHTWQLNTTAQSVAVMVTSSQLLREEESPCDTLIKFAPASETTLKLQMVFIYLLKCEAVVSAPSITQFWKTVVGSVPECCRCVSEHFSAV